MPRVIRRFQYYYKTYNNIIIKYHLIKKMLNIYPDKCLIKDFTVSYTVFSVYNSFYLNLNACLLSKLHRF